MSNPPKDESILACYMYTQVCLLACLLKGGQVGKYKQITAIDWFQRRDLIDPNTRSSTFGPRVKQLMGVMMTAGKSIDEIDEARG